VQSVIVELLSPGPRSRTGVLFVNTSMRPPLGADIAVQAQVVATLDRTAHDVYTACATGHRSAPTPTFQRMRGVPDLQIVPVDFGPERCCRTRWAKAAVLAASLPAVASLARLAMVIRRSHISIIHTTDRPRDAAAAVLLARLTGARCLIHVHVAHGEWMSRLRKWSMRHSDALLAISDFVAASLADSGHPRERTFVVHNAIDIDGWEPGAGRADIRRELGIPAEAPVVVTVCRLFPEKGPADLIRAVAEVRRVEPEVRLVIVGEDLDASGWYRRELGRLVTELALDGHVVFTGRRSDVARLMAAADVFAMPSFEEPFGLVFLEAMAMRLPVVALDSGGTPEVVEHGRTGLLSRAGDHRQLAANLLALVREPALRTAMGDLGRERVVRLFSPGRMAREVGSVYQQVLAQARSGGPVMPRRLPLLAQRQG
jgi:glycosyltransferase involved in cell wall biosynthesis